MTDIEIDDILARTDRARAEAEKLRVEQIKLLYEALKLERERTTIFVTSAAAAGGAIAVIGGLALRLIYGH